MANELKEKVFELTKEEINSALWKKLSAHLENRINSFRVQNESSLSIEQTEKLRGKIALAKELLGLDPDMGN